MIKAFGLGNANYPIVIAEMPTASNVLDTELSEDERGDLIGTLAFHPECGEPLNGSILRVRKFKWFYGAEKRKRMLRVIYFFYDLNMPLYVLAIYTQGEVIRLSKREETEMLLLTEELVQTHASRNYGHVKSQNLSA